MWLCDNEHLGRPKTAATDDTIAQIHQMVYLQRTIHTELQFRCEIFVRALDGAFATFGPKRVRMNISNVLVAQFRRNESVLAPTNHCR